MPGWIVSEPEVGSRVPARILNSVVFPEPLRPMIPHRSPFATVKVTPENRTVAPNRTLRFDAEMRVNLLLVDLNQRRESSHVCATRLSSPKLL